MLDVFLALKAALKINSVNIDNVIFSLHYKFTFLFLVAASVLVTCKQYIGDPIDCIHNAGSNYPNNVMVNHFRLIKKIEITSCLSLIDMTGYLLLGPLDVHDPQRN
jgi:Innexin